ncbi:outer membrane beta-barrel protein [Photobacterium ganghwense]|uniref:outer membrane beta-barrel protein n=1 Tax=Photobacterium ganghwense TaxID=320778 RepID=UPI0039F0139D
MRKRITLAGFIFSLFPATVWCENASQGLTDIQPASDLRYFVGLRAGASQMGNDDKATLVNGGLFTSDDSSYAGFGGLDFGVYSQKWNTRMYYSYEYHTSTTEFEGDDAYDINTHLHMLSADRIFRPDSSIQPFVGLHFGYAFAKSDSRFNDKYENDGFVFGFQAGVDWRISDSVAVELGLRHSVLPSDRTNWSAEDSQGQPVNVETQLTGVSSAYLGASYRF